MTTGSSDTPVRRILLVEDDLDQAHLVKFLLEDGGRYAVTLAQDGVRGTHLATERRWDLVVTDLNLPGVDGIQVLEASLRKHPDTPVLATTGYTGPEYADQAMHKGAAHVLIKPLQRDELLGKVEELIGRARVQAEKPHVVDEDSTARAVTSFRVLAIGVRPGDVEAGCGGLLARHRDDEDRVVVLTLSHGSGGEEGRRRREEAKEAGRSMGVRFFVGNAGSGDDPLEEDLRRLVEGAVHEIRPDIIYIPTRHHPDPSFRVVHEAAVAASREGGVILAYDPGDGSPEFRPGVFVPIPATLEEKLRVLQTFDPEDGGYLDPESVHVSAKFWSRHASGRSAEPLEVVRGDPPGGLLEGC